MTATTEFETIFHKKYLYDGIQNIQFSDKSPTVYLLNQGDRVYIDVKFTALGTYKIMADIEFNRNQTVNLQTGLIYPGFQQHPQKLITQSIPNNPNIQYNLISELTISDNTNQGLTQPLFIRNASKLPRRINIKNIKVTGPAPIEYAYTEWWNQELKTGKRPYQHADNLYSNSKFKDIVNPRHMYKEMIILKWQRHTYATAINGPCCYMGIDFSAGNVIFSVWNATKDGVEIPNQILETGPKSTSRGFGHEGSGSNFNLAYNKEFPDIKLQLRHKFGFYVRYDEVNGCVTEYSGYFINLGPIDKPFENPEWIYLGKVRHHTTYVIEPVIGGFLENFMTANGHLFQRSVAMGNSWMSVDGQTWQASAHEEVVLFDIKNQQSSAFTECGTEGFVVYSAGGRLGMPNDDGLTKHGDLRAFDLYRDTTPEQVPKHLIGGMLPK